MAGNRRRARETPQGTTNSAHVLPRDAIQAPSLISPSSTISPLQDASRKHQNRTFLSSHFPPVNPGDHSNVIGFLIAISHIKSPNKLQFLAEEHLFVVLCVARKAQ